MWKVKFIAAAKHALVTLLVATTTYILVFQFWYPGAFSQLMPGTKLFLLILGVEVVLGPCMSLVIFNPAKPVRELWFDYALIIIIQLGAFTYGVVSVVQSRPAYVVFVKDRLEVVSAAEISKRDLAAANNERFKKIPWFGPEFVCARAPQGPKEREQLLFVEMPAGKDVQHLPKFYRECEAHELARSGRSLAQLKTVAQSRSNAQALSNIAALSSDIKWLPVIGKMGVWTAIIEPTSNTPVLYINFDPF